MIAQAMLNSERFFWISFSTTLQIITATQTTLYHFFFGGGQRYWSEHLFQNRNKAFTFHGSYKTLRDVGGIIGKWIRHEIVKMFF